MIIFIPKKLTRVSYARVNIQKKCGLQNGGGRRMRYPELKDFLSGGPRENVQIRDYKSYLEIHIMTLSIRSVYRVTPGFDAVMVEIEMDYGQFGKIKKKWTFKHQQFTQEAMIATISVQMQDAQNRFHNSI